jgi:hypothetical protein
MSSRLRQAYVAAKLRHLEHLATRAHQSGAAACSSVTFGAVPSAKLDATSDARMGFSQEQTLRYTFS